jgi:AcrR family transcriptional regulator
MARKYDSSRRLEAAQKTKEDILDAAVKLHGIGVLDFEALAREAKVSPATVRKYFPSREELYAGCTSWAMRDLIPPDLDELAVIQDAKERVRACVGQLHRFYQPIWGQLWTGYTIRQESAVVAGLLDELEDLEDAVAGLVVAAWPAEVAGNPEARGLVRGFLSYLTYFALIREGGLTSEQATSRIGEAILSSLQAMSRRSEKEVAAT